jgi:hypothetical protein
MDLLVSVAMPMPKFETKKKEIKKKWSISGASPQD